MVEGKTNDGKRLGGSSCLRGASFRYDVLDRRSVEILLSDDFPEPLLHKKKFGPSLPSQIVGSPSKLFDQKTGSHLGKSARRIVEVHDDGRWIDDGS